MMYISAKFQVDSTSLSLVLIVLLPKEILIENNTWHFSDFTKTTCNFFPAMIFFSTSPHSLFPRDYTNRKIMFQPSTKGAQQKKKSGPWHPDYQSINENIIPSVVKCWRPNIVETFI